MGPRPSNYRLLGALLLSCWPRLAAAERLRAELSLPRGSELQVAVLVDGLHVGLLVANTNGHALEQALAPLHAEHVELLPFGKNEQMAVLTFGRTVASARAELVHEARGGREHAPSGEAKATKDAGAAGSGQGAGAAAGAPGGLAAPGAPGSVQAGSTAPAQANAATGGSGGGAPGGTVVGPGAAGGNGAASAPGKADDKHSKPSAKKQPRMLVALHVELTDPRAAVLEHVLAEGLPLPATLAHHRIYDAEKAFVAGRLAEAELMFAGLRPEGPFAAWVSVRQGDLALHHDLPAVACAHYLTALSAGDVRVAGQLASLRAYVLGCPNTPAIAWASLLRRDGRDDPVGRRLAKEAQWALTYAQGEGDIDDALGAAGHRRGEALPSALYDALAARALRRRAAFPRVLAALARPALPGQHEAFDLGLLLGQAYCELDIAADWHPPAVKDLSWAKLRPKQKKDLLAAVKRCAGLSNAGLAEHMAKAPPPAVVADLATIERRMHVVTAAATRVASHARAAKPKKN